jgi:2-iminoacetate synthase
MTDKQLIQLICAFRLFNGEVELSLSTRETPLFRDNAIPLGITSVSAASKTQPGGYATNMPELEQFSVGDERSAATVEQAIESRGIKVVWHDWNRAYSG